MEFYLSKILWQIFNPLNIFLVLFFLSYFLNFFHYRKLSNTLYVFSLIFFFSIIIIPIGSYLLFLLEKDFHSQPNINQIDGILILSGATNPYLSIEHNQVNLNDSSERLFESIIMIKNNPNTKVIFSGGSGSLRFKSLDHAAIAKIFFYKMGVDSNKIIYENKSRNTYENIFLSKEIANPKKNEKWLIITSAFHMKRSLLVAEKLGWNLIPYATDFNEPKKFSLILTFNLFKNLSKFQKASHEWIGIISYYFLGKTSKILY